MDIRLIKGDKIDKTKWNSCVHYATHGNIFAYQWYLKNTTTDWDALVEGDYESVMPLVWQKRLPRGRELFVPDMIRDLGVYSIHLLSTARIKHFLEAIPNSYSRQQIHFNQGTSVPAIEGYQLNIIDNHLLYLQESYETIAKSYAPAFVQQVERAEQRQLLPTSNIKPEKVADFYKAHSQQKKGLEQRYHAYLRIMYNALHRGWGFASGVVNQQEELCASCFFLYSHNKVMALLPACSAEGREFGAEAFMLDLLIRSHAGRPMILDFNTYRSEWPLALLEEVGSTVSNFTQVQKKGSWWKG